MALGFFRRRQKMVVIIMVLLMVSFLIGGMGFDMLLGRGSPDDLVVGTTRTGEITQGDLRVAQADIGLLRDTFGLGNPYRVNLVAYDTEFFLLMQNGDRRAVDTYAMLLEEAARADIPVTEKDVTEFFISLGIAESDYDKLMAELSTGRRAMPERQVRAVAARWLMVHKTFQRALVGAPPSEPDLAHTFRDLKEQIKLSLVKIPAEKFLDDVPPPRDDDARLAEHFNKHRAKTPDTYAGPSSLGFGYRQPDRVQILSMHIREDAVRQAIAQIGVEEDTVLRYFERHKAEFTKQVPLESESRPATAPAAATQTAPATEPATQPSEPEPVKTRTEYLTYAEAHPQIIELISTDRARAKVDEITTRCEELIRQHPGPEETGGQNAYEWARSRLMRPADDVVNAGIGSVNILHLPLRDAVAELARKAGIKAICFPWGKHEDAELAPDVLVTLKAESIALGDALNRLSLQVKWPALTWELCTEIDGVLFAASGVDYSPIRVKQTDMLDLKQFSDDPLLSMCAAPAPTSIPLWMAAFSAKEFPRSRWAVPSRVSIGKDGMRMMVAGDGGGRLQWRLLKAAPAHSSPTFAEALVQADRDPIMRRTIERAKKDLRVKLAFERVRDYADRIATPAELEEAVERDKLETVETDMFSRRTSEGWTDLPELNLPTQEIRAEFIRQAFSLAPKDPDAEHPEKSDRIVTVLLPSRRMAVIMRRIGYTPPYRQDYEEQKSYIAFIVLGQRQRAILQYWFSYAGIVDRVDFKPEKQ